MVKKKVKLICMVVLIVFISSGIAFACYLKSKSRSGDHGWCGECSNKPGMILCCAPYQKESGWWYCMAGGAGKDGRSLEEAVAKTCGCE